MTKKEYYIIAGIFVIGAGILGFSSNGITGMLSGVGASIIGFCLGRLMSDWE